MEDKIPQDQDNNEIDFVDIEEQIEKADTMKSKMVNDIQEKKTKEISSETKDDLYAKILSLQKELDGKETEIRKINNRYLRALADYENLNKRTKSEKAKLLKNANATLLTNFLDLADSFDKAKESYSDNSADLKVVKEGLQAIEQLFLTLLNNEGVKKINCIGEKFDPAFHEAISVRSEAGLGDDIILDEIQAGYLQNNVLLRPSKVIISKNTNKGENKDA
jgi:molecular chaperone GrpE